MKVTTMAKSCFSFIIAHKSSLAFHFFRNELNWVVFNTTMSQINYAWLLRWKIAIYLFFLLEKETLFCTCFCL